MNHLTALQRKTDGRWDYTYSCIPWGYCRAYKPISEDAPLLMPLDRIKEDNLKSAAFKDKHHNTGHATVKEAEECYKEYLLDQCLRLMPSEPDNATQQFRCRVCNKFTACYAAVGAYRLFVLCPDHQSREEVAKLLSVGESWES